MSELFSSLADNMMLSRIEEKYSGLQGSTIASKSDDSVLVLCSMLVDTFSLNLDSLTGKKVCRFLSLDINIAHRLTVSVVAESGWQRFLVLKQTRHLDKRRSLLHLTCLLPSDSFSTGDRNLESPRLQGRI